nr:NADPH-dependent FMN reductase [Vannielia litorea]
MLAVPGSARAASTNRAFLAALAELAPPELGISLWDGLAGLPIFSPDLEAAPPPPVRDWAAQVGRADGLLLAVPEYVHALPGGFKNAIDWLVSREEIIGKPVALGMARTGAKRRWPSCAG